MCQVSELVMPVMTGGVDLYTGWHILLGNGPWDARVASPPFSWVALAAATAQARLAGPSQHRKVQHSTSQTHITMASSCKQPMEAPQGCFCLWVGIYKLLKSRWNRGWAECRKDEKQFCAKPCVRTCPSRKMSWFSSEAGFSQEPKNGHPASPSPGYYCWLSFGADKILVSN